MTDAATRFVAPLTFQALSGRPVRLGLFEAADEAAMGHIDLARWADAILIAPASADFLARLRAGLADDLLSTLCLAADAPVIVAPAMNQAMWRAAATQDNLRVLRERGVRVWGPAEGVQACGESGPGRMLEPEEILRALNGALDVAGDARQAPLAGVDVLLTAGPTWEAIDPVRFIGNRSSGKMGFALARAARAAGARVLLVSGPVTLETPPGVERISVESAREMHRSVMRHAPGCDIFIGAAAVADFRPAQVASEKLKKGDSGSMELALVRNPDVLASVAALPEPPFTVGFAAETQDLRANALEKLRRKGVDIILANQVGGEEGGFDRDHNAVILLTADEERSFALQEKGRLARAIIAALAERYRARRTT